MQHALGRAPIDHDLRVRKGAEVGRIGVDRRDLALHRFPHVFRLELHVAALAREQAQHGHLVVLMGGDIEVRAIGAVRHEPLVDIGGRERYGDTRFPRERRDQ